MTFSSFGGQYPSGGFNCFQNGRSIWFCERNFKCNGRTIYQRETCWFAIIRFSRGFCAKRAISATLACHGRGGLTDGGMYRQNKKPSCEQFITFSTPFWIPLRPTAFQMRLPNRLSCLTLNSSFFPPLCIFKETSLLWSETLCTMFSDG